MNLRDTSIKHITHTHIHIVSEAGWLPMTCKNTLKRQAVCVVQRPQTSPNLLNTVTLKHPQHTKRVQLTE